MDAMTGLSTDSFQLGSSLLNISASKQQQQQDILYITDNHVTDSQLTTSLWLNALLGLIFFLSFCVLQRSVFPQHYRFRLVSASVTVKPRELPTKGLFSLWAWLWTAWDVNDDEIMRSSGLDAVVMIKALQMGVEIFVPLALVGCAVLLPVHHLYKDRDVFTVFNRSQLMQLTIAALPRGSDVMWLHFVLTIGYNLWVMWVLARYFKDFVLVRQHYLSKGDDPNYWMALTQQADAEHVSKKVRKMLAEINQPCSSQTFKNEQPPPPEPCTSPQPTDLASNATIKPGWLGSVTDRMSRLAQRMSRTNLFSRSSDSYRPYTGEGSPPHSPNAYSPSGSDHRCVHLNRTASGSGRSANGVDASAGGSEGMDSSLCNSKDSAEGMATGRAAAPESESGAAVSGGGKRWSSSSGSCAGTVAFGGSENDSVAAGSSRGGADTSSGSESSGGGALHALDNISRKLRLSGSRGGSSGGKISAPQVAAGTAGPVGSAPTYQTISELHSMTAAQIASSGFPSHLWPPVPKHMRTITEDSLEYRLDALLGASRPNSRGGMANPTGNQRNSSSSGAELSPCAASARAGHAAVLAAATQVPTGPGSTCGLLSTDGSSSSSQVLHGAGPSGSSTGHATASCGPSVLSRVSTAHTHVALAGATPPLPPGCGGAVQHAPDDSASSTAVCSVAGSRAPSLAAGVAWQGSREAPHMRASMTSLDSIDEGSSVGTCIVHHSAASSPGLHGCSPRSSQDASTSENGSPVPQQQAGDTSGNGRTTTTRDASFAGVVLQGPFAEAAMNAGDSSGNSSRRDSMQAGVSTHGCMLLDGSQQPCEHLEATLGPLSQDDIRIDLPVVPGLKSQVVSAQGSRHKRNAKQQQQRQTRECSIDFSKQNLPDLSTWNMSLLQPDLQAGGSSTSCVPHGTQQSPEDRTHAGTRSSPFANSDCIASSIAAAGVAMVGGPTPLVMPETATPDSLGMRMPHNVPHQQTVQDKQLATRANTTQQQQSDQVDHGDFQAQAFEIKQQLQQSAVTKQQQQQQRRTSAHSSQPSANHSQQGSQNGSSTTSSTTRQQRQRVQQWSAHSSTEHSPSSQAGIPPYWSASWQHQQQQAQLRGAATASPGSASNSRALSPVGGSCIALQQTQAVAGAAVGAGQELTPAALAAAAGGTLAESAVERLQQLFQEGMMVNGSTEMGRHGDQRHVAYHWWKELPAEQLRKCDSLISEQQAWLDVADRPLLAKPSVRFRKTINTKRTGPDGLEYPISVNAQHYAVLVTDVQPCCPYAELEEATRLASQQSMLNRAWSFLGDWLDKLTPRPRSWGVRAYRRYLGDPGLESDSWPFGDTPLPPSQDLPHLGLSTQQSIHRPNSRLFLDTPATGRGDGGVPWATEGTPSGRPGVLRRYSQLPSGQASNEGMGLPLPSSTGTAAAGAHLARLSQSSHLSHLSLLPDSRPEEQMMYLQQQIQWAVHKLQQDVAAGVVTPRDSDKRMAKIARVHADFKEKLAASERMTTLSRETSILLPAVGRTSIHMRVPLSAVTGSGFTSAALTPEGVSRCSSFRSAAPRGGPRGPSSAVAGAAVGNPDFGASKAVADVVAASASRRCSFQLTPGPPTPWSPMRGQSEAGGPQSLRDRVVDIAAGGGSGPLQVLQHRLPPTLISSSSLQQRLQRMRVGASNRQLSVFASGLDAGDLPLNMFNSASSNFALRSQLSMLGDPEANQGRKTGSTSLLTQQMSGELGRPSPQQQQQEKEADLEGHEDGAHQSTPAAEIVRLPPRYSRQCTSPSASPRTAHNNLRTSINTSESTATPGTEAHSDSLEPSAGQSSSVHHKLGGQFNKPFPPDHPHTTGYGSSLSSRSHHSSQNSSSSGSRAINGVIMHSATGRMLRPSSGNEGAKGQDLSGRVGRGSHALPTSAGGSSTSTSLAAAARVLSSSGGSVHPGSSGGGGSGMSLHPMPPLPMAGRGKSGRSTAHCEHQQVSHIKRCSPEHLALIIPPCPQMPPSRSGTPGATGGVPTQAGMSSLQVPPQPWGLPPDAALLNTSYGSSPQVLQGPWGSGSKNHRATTGGIDLQALPPQHTLPRWSAGGVPEHRLSLGHGTPSGQAHSRGTSPLLSEHELPSAVAVAGVPVQLKSTATPSSRSASAAQEAAVTAAIIDPADVAPVDPLDDLYFQPLTSQLRHLPIPPHVRGWARVRWAYRTRELLDLPRRESYDIVSATFSRLFPEDFDRAIPVIKHKGVDKLLLQWEAAVAALERAEFKKRRTGREPMRLAGACGAACGFCAESVSCACLDSAIGCLMKPSKCLPEGSTIKVIPELQENIANLEADIERARRSAFSSAFTPSWFVLFKSQSAAMMAASTRIYAHDNTKFQVHPAPGPEEVNWQHIWMSAFERDMRTAFTWPLILAVVLFPITLVTSAASRLEYVFCPQSPSVQGAASLYWEWYCVGREQGSSLQAFMRAFITGWLPSLLLNLWLAMVMPRLVYLLVQMEGNCFSLSALERRIGAIFFYWDVYNMFLQGTIGSTFFQQVHNIIQSPEKLPTILGAALPDSSNFFMQFIAMRALFLIWLRLCVPHGGVWQNWLHYCCCPSMFCSVCNTERDKSLTYGPRTPRYGFEMGHMLLMYLIALAFAIVSPLLLPFSVVWFAFAWLAWRHNLSYVYQRKYESGGLMWIFLFSRIVMCLVIGQLFTFCVLVVRGAYWQAFLIIAFMPALTLRYYRYCQARYAKGVEYGVPLDVAHRAARARVPALAYIPPPLQDRSWGWYPEWQKIWEGWGMPTYAAV